MAIPNGGLITQTNEQYYTGDDYGSYRYISINDIIDNFIISYVGVGKLLPSIKRTDIIFHAKRAMACSLFFNIMYIHMYIYIYN